MSQENLKKVWESSHRCTKEDWLEWMRRLGVELLAHSSSSALRSCHQLALVQPNMARELFSVGAPPTQSPIALSCSTHTVLSIFRAYHPFCT